MSTGHHPYSPSRLGRIALCPGSVALEAEAEEKGLAFDDNADAAEGTLLHARALAHEPDYSGLTDEQSEIICRARDYLFARLRGAEILQEFPIQVWHPNIVEEPITRGTADAVAVYPGEVRIVDLKFGRAEIHQDLAYWQMKAYAVGAMQVFKLNHAEVWVYQPREQIEYQRSFAAPECGAGLAIDIEAEIQYAKDHPTEYHPSLAACRYCRGRSLCPAFREELVETLPTLAPKAEVLDLAMLLDLLEVAARAEPWCRQVKDAARKVLEGGQELDGWTLGERRVRKVKSVDSLHGAVDGVLTQDEFLQNCDVRIGALETAYAEKVAAAGGGTKAAAKRMFADLTEGAVEIEVQKYLKRKEA